MAALKPDFDELVAQLEPVSASWEQFAIHLGFDYNRIMAIRRDELGVTNQLSRMLSLWRGENTDCSWVDVVKSLRAMRWNELAESTESKHINGIVATDGPPAPLPQSPPTYKIEDLHECIDRVVNNNYSKLSRVFEGGLTGLSLELFSKGIITNDVQKEPSFDGIMSCFKAGLAYKTDLGEVGDYCGVFFKAFYTIGGPFKVAADKLKNEIIASVKRELRIDMTI